MAKATAKTAGKAAHAAENAEHTPAEATTAKTVKKATRKRAKADSTTAASATDAMAPEAQRQESAPGALEQIAEPSVEPAPAPVTGVPHDSGKEEINEDLPVNPAPKQHLPRRQETPDRRNDRRAPRHEHNEDACRCYDSPYPKGKLPPPPVLQPRELEDAEKPKPKTGKDGFDKAMSILNEYYEDVPVRDPRFDQTRED